jgi:hypothetical protein
MTFNNATLSHTIVGTAGPDIVWPAGTHVIVVIDFFRSSLNSTAWNFVNASLPAWGWQNIFATVFIGNSTLSSNSTLPDWSTSSPFLPVSWKSAVNANWVSPFSLTSPSFPSLQASNIPVWAAFGSYNGNFIYFRSFSPNLFLLFHYN